ncbi:MAG TPA: PQQ-dependent sugar dehydrogenase [Pyrinomonadaceae bacterium]|jgi:glucose/arabinose dehydrogenase
MKRLLFLIPACLVFVLACGGSAPTGRGAGEVESTQDNGVQFRIETVVSGLEVPWSIAFAPDGRMFITERPGRVRVFENGQLRPQPIATIEDVRSASESGLMGLVLHPQFATNHLLYLSYAYAGGDGQLVRVVRYRETNDALTERTLVIENIPATPNHAGCRLRFGPDGKLYVTTGDATDRELAQKMDSLAGKTLRLNDDGSVPTDNPFVSQQGVRPEIWSLGHRNAQGIDFQPGSNLMFQTEHGPSGFDGPGGGDEVNIVERAKNYGWPIIHHRQSREGLESPLLEYTPACAPASGTFYRGSLFQQFRGNYFFGCLRGQRLIRVVLDGRRVVSQEDLLKDRYGRIREVMEGPDGAIYFSTSNRDGRGSAAGDDDRVLKLVPVR